MDDIGNVYGVIPGRGTARPLVVSAHTDTVFPLETNLQLRRAAGRIYGPGIGDNSLGVAGLLGVLWGLQDREISLPGDLVLVANVGEEGLGDCKGMQAVVERYQGKPLAYICLEGMALGHIFHRGMGVRRYRINLRTGGGHSWVDYGRPSAIHEMAGLIQRLTAISLPEAPRSTMNVGVVAGGTSVNTIAAEASCELDLRSEGAETLRRMDKEAQRIIRASANQEVEVSQTLIGERPSCAIPPDHPLVTLAEKSLMVQGITPFLSIGSTDASIPLSRGYPSVCIGLTTGSGAHSLDEFIHTEPVEKGLEQVLWLVKNVFVKLDP
jgi:acetylornithine deacetylase/succinyl-diaminopimelate desuccinylase-like protein